MVQIHLEEPLAAHEQGDILCFLTGQEEIEACAEMLEDKAENLPPDAPNLLICPLFAALPMQEQLKVFRE